MKKFAVDLIDESYSCYFGIDSHNKKEYTVKNKTGLLKRQYNDQWASKSHELTSLTEAGEFLDKKIKLKRSG